MHILKIVPRISFTRIRYKAIKECVLQVQRWQKATVYVASHPKLSTSNLSCWFQWRTYGPVLIGLGTGTANVVPVKAALQQFKSSLC